jgi:hypothetical protein
LAVRGFVVRALRYVLDDVAEAAFFAAPRIGSAEFLMRE